ncbi:hypothetical protein ABZ848_23185 [Streptomyces sp. NPDC047081]|uniref:hypothetical protein n=1 Tax=Streptomyces sp. NPDC047081 TaxID=3154706 RepID=UPI0033E21F8C
MVEVPGKTASGSPSQQDGEATAAVCVGQPGLERRVLEALIEYTKDVGPVGGGLLGLRAASAGPACLHVEGEPTLLGYLVHRLCPAIVGGGAYFVGVPGLRLARSRPGRLELRFRDGHGRLVLHLDAVGERVLDEWDRDRATVYRGGRCALGTVDGLHPAELEALRHRAEAIVDARWSLELRRIVRRLPAIPDPHVRCVAVRIGRMPS